jgi:hypothetical protein
VNITMRCWESWAMARPNLPTCGPGRSSRE